MRYFAMLAFLIFVVPLSLFGTTHEEEQTLSIIKPDGVTNQHIGDVLNRFEKSGLKIVGLKMIRLSPDQAQKFSEIHKDYPELIQYLNSGPIVAIVLQGPDAAAKNQKLMGPPDPTKAGKGTLRADFGKSMKENVVYGSHDANSAKKEIEIFFTSDELVSPALTPVH